MKRPTGPQLAMMLALFLAPLIGGQLSVDAQPLVGSAFAAVMGGGEAPMLTAALLAWAPLGALGYVLLRSRAVQTPATSVWLSIALLMGLLGASLTVSAFRYVSMQEWSRWLAYAAVLAATVAVSGRQRGPRLLLWALVAGCSLVALRGVAEYGQMRAIDPTWRVFAGWVNQNALAGVLMLGLFPALGLLLVERRLAALMAGVGATLILFGLVLTQSRGGFLAVGVGAVSFIALALAWSWPSGREGRLRVGLVTAPFLLAGLMALGLQASTPKQSGGVLGRVTQGGAAEAESSGFRRLLWRSAAQIARENPMGVGVGAYRFTSARPGLTPQTHLAHNTYLQLAAEAGPLAGATLVAAGLFWITACFRGARRLPWEANMTRAGVVAAIVASGAHNLIDSDLYHFGTGMAFFALLGIGLQLSSDGSGPELLTPWLRRGGALATLCVGGWMTLFGIAELYRAQAIGAALTGDTAEAIAYVDRSIAIAPSSGEAWAIKSQYEPDHGLEYAERAAKLQPSSRNLRRLADLQVVAGRPDDAKQSLVGALRRDPNNLLALLRLLRLQAQLGETEAARATARRLVAVEATPYWQVRALPEVIPTETFVARAYLAEQERDPNRKALLLQPALDGYVEYATRTAPRVAQMAKDDPAASFAGETMDDVSRKLSEGGRIAIELAAIYRSLGDGAKAGAAVEAAGRLAL